MPKLTDTQIIVLSRAATRPGNLAMPLPEGLNGAAAKMAVTAMINRGWLEEVEANLRRGEPMWRAVDRGGVGGLDEEGEPRRALVVDEGVEAFGTRGSPDRDPFDRCQRGGAQFWEVVSRKRANDDPLAAPFPRHPPTLPNGHRPRTPPS